MSIFLAPSNYIKVYFIHTQWRSSWKLYTTSPELTTSWCSIIQTVPTYAFVDHRSFQLWAAMNWSQSSLCVLSVHYTVFWQQFTAIWIYLYPLACCFIFFLLVVLRMSINCASCVTFPEAELGALQWNTWRLHWGCVPLSDAMDEEPVNRLDSDLLSHCWGISVAFSWWCALEEEDDNEKKWEVLKNILLASS